MQYTKLFMCEAHVPETIAPAPVIFREKWALFFFSTRASPTVEHLIPIAIAMSEHSWQLRG